MALALDRENKVTTESYGESSNRVRNDIKNTYVVSKPMREELPVLPYCSQLLTSWGSKVFILLTVKRGLLMAHNWVYQKQFPSADGSALTKLKVASQGEPTCEHTMAWPTLCSFKQLLKGQSCFKFPFIKSVQIALKLKALSAQVLLLLLQMLCMRTLPPWQPPFRISFLETLPHDMHCLCFLEQMQVISLGIL